MKQRIAAAMLIILMPLSLAACGGEKANPSSATPSSESSSAATQNTAIKKSVDQVTADWRNAGEKAAAISTTNGSGLNEYTQAVNDVSTHQNELFATCGLMSTSN